MAKISSRSLTQQTNQISIAMRQNVPLQDLDQRLEVIKATSSTCVVNPLDAINKRIIVCDEDGKDDGDMRVSNSIATKSSIRQFDETKPVSFTQSQAIPLCAFQEQGFAYACEDLFEVIDAVIHLTCQSDLVDVHFEQACAGGWHIALDDLDDQEFQLNTKNRCIILNAAGLKPAHVARSANWMMSLSCAFIQALRAVAQEERHGRYSEKYAPESLLHIERLRAADSATMLIASAWDIADAGDKSLWRYVLSSPFSDMAYDFDGYLAACPDVTDFHFYDAMNAAFTQWYACAARVNMCDHEILEAIDAVLMEQGHGAIGKAYIKPRDIEAFSCLPTSNIAYLQNRGEELTRDPYYCAMNECVNQSHFFQIMQDLEATLVSGIAFRDATLAAKIFPNAT